MRYLAASAAVIFAFAACRAEDTKSPEGFRSLFNGTDLKGWKVNEGGNIKVWGAEKGVIHVSGGGGGWLMTEEEFADFEVMFEYKMPKMGNSGFCLRSPLKGDPAYVGMEIQLIDEMNWPGLRPTQLTGSIYDVVGPSKQVTKPNGEWNAMRIICKGRNVSIQVNGEDVVAANLDDYKSKFERHPGLTREKGHIGFQSYNYRVEYRNIFIKPLN